jgi:SAM-dependent methyltransferase
MKSLKQIYENYTGPEGWGDKGTAHTYIDEYEHLLKEYRNGSTVLEIGIAFGHSCNMWCDYFIDSTIVGVDIDDHGIDRNNTRYVPIFADATSPDVLPYIEQYTFDVIIDDGSHHLGDQLNSYNILKHKLSPNGIYIIEDVANLDSVRGVFESLDDAKSISIIDNRSKKGRYDDVLIVIKNK